MMRAVLFTTVMLAGIFGSVSAVAAPAEWSSLHMVMSDGKPASEDLLRGRVVLFVNVASYCSYTVQYSALEAIYRRYQAQGLVIVGVPSNQFGSQEPGSDKEIHNFCSTRYGVTFPLLTKQDVNGEQRSDLYDWLVASKPGANRPIGWNFEKFLVGRGGEVVGRFPSHIVPDDPQLTTAIEYALAVGP